MMTPKQQEVVTPHVTSSHNEESETLALSVANTHDSAANRVDAVKALRAREAALWPLRTAGGAR